jgi:hypothetical protein
MWPAAVRGKEALFKVPPAESTQQTKSKEKREMTDTAGYVQVHEKKPEPVRDPILVIKFQVQARSAKCKCVVTASVGTDAKVRMIAVHKCPGHEELEKKLADQARIVALRLLSNYESTSNDEEATIG